jgi:hypothetical protein
MLLTLPCSHGKGCLRAEYVNKCKREIAMGGLILGLMNGVFSYTLVLIHNW